MTNEEPLKERDNENTKRIHAFFEETEKMHGQNTLFQILMGMIVTCENAKDIVRGLDELDEEALKDDDFNLSMARKLDDAGVRVSAVTFNYLQERMNDY